uniref:F-box domain-containing protein n=1 Tax=Parastrongyloides trichosuri TaxID=131310 RepID=A0A0N4Z8W0_PARTI
MRELRSSTKILKNDESKPTTSKIPCNQKNKNTKNGERSRSKRKSNQEDEGIICIKKPNINVESNNFLSQLILRKKQNINLEASTEMSWIKMFQSMSEDEKSRALELFVNKTGMDTKREIKNLVDPFFMKDFIALLPYEISLEILSKLSATDIIRASMTSSTWKRLSEDSKLWQNLCKRDNLKLLNKQAVRTGNWINLKNTLHQRSYRALTPPNNSPRQDSPIPITNLPSCYKRCQWKAKYLRSIKTTRNWFNATPTYRCELKGHEEHVITCLHVRSDIVVTCSDDNKLKIWNPYTATCTHTLEGHNGGVWTSQLSDDGSMLISGSTDRTVKVWCTKTGKLVHDLVGHTSTVRCMALHGNILVSGSRDCTLRVWDIKTGELIRILQGHLAAVRCVQFDGERIVSGAYDYFVKIWSLHTGNGIHTLVGHSNRVYSVLFDSAQDIIVSGSLDTTIIVWNAITGAALHTLFGHQSLTSGMRLNGDILVSGNADATIKIWNIRKGECIHTLAGTRKHTSAVTSIEILDDRYIISSSDDGKVKLWCADTGNHIRDLLTLDSAGLGGCIWKIVATPTMLIAAVGSRGHNQIEDTRVIMLDYDAGYPE